ncbi:MAG: hypothetical protein ACO3F2_02825 [Roseiflexaceae bacterium]
MAKAEIVLIGTDDGVVLLSNPGGIGRWLKSAHALRNHAIVATWAHPNDPTQMLCSDGTQLWRSVDGGQQWDSITGPACQRLIASRSTPNRIWAHDGQTAYLSHDAGITWHILAPADEIAGGGDVLWYRHDTRGHLTTSHDMAWTETPTWSHVVVSHDGQHIWHSDTNHLSTAHHIIDETPSAFIPLLACAGDSCVVGTAPNGMWRYTDTWQIIDGLSAQSITVMTTTLYHPDRAWAGDTNGNVWYSSNRCVTWELIRGGFTSIRALATARLV